MAKFLDLRRQRAGAALIEAGYHEPQDAAEDRQREAVPFDRGVVFGVAVIEEIAVLDEQQAVHDQRRDAGVIAECIQREPGAVDLVTVAVENPQSGAVLFRVDREGAETDKAVEPLRPPRLPLDREMALLESLGELRQRDIAEPLVIGSMFREADRVAGAGLSRERHAAVEPGEDPRLQIGGAHLVMNAPADQRQDRQHHHPA